MTEKDPADHLFELIRFAVPSTWSDWAVDRLVTRIQAEEPDDRTMPRGLDHAQRRQYHATFKNPR